MVRIRKVCLFPVGEYQFSGAAAQVSIIVFVLSYVHHFIANRFDGKTNFSS